MRQFLLLLSGSARRPGPFPPLKRNELLKDHVVQRVENVSDRTPLVSKNFFSPQAVFPAFRESHLEVYGYLELTLDFLPSLYRRQLSKPVRGGSQKKASFKCGKIPTTSLSKFPNYFLGSGQCSFWLACMCPTNTTQPVLAAVRPLPSAAGRHPFPPTRFSGAESALLRAVSGRSAVLSRRLDSLHSSGDHHLRCDWVGNPTPAVVAARVAASWLSSDV